MERDAYAALHAAGVTFIRTGPTANRHWDDQSIEVEQQYEEAAAAAGLRCMPWLKELSSIEPQNTRRTEMLRRVVTRFRGHPGLGIWKGADEPEWGKLPVPPLVRAHDLVLQLDPDHPLWIVQAPRGTVRTLLPYDSAYDIAGCDVYPVSYPPGIHSLRANKEISMVGDYTRTMRAVAGRKPVWMTLQIAWSGVTPPRKTLRFPTFEQERFMSYEAIINGARGLVFFGGHIPATWSTRDAVLKWNWTFFQRVLGPLLQEIGERSPLEPALVASDASIAIRATELNGKPAQGLECCVRRTGDAMYILACKREAPTVRIGFDGLPPAAMEGDVMFESSRTIKIIDGSFTDWFGPF